MLPKRSRLTSSEVRAILKSGRSVRLGGVSAKYTDGAGAKAAVVVSSKVAKSAVKRNALRRSAYEALKGTLPSHKQVVFFIHTATYNPRELQQLCSKLS